jgi:hypothetical protein
MVTPVDGATIVRCDHVSVAVLTAKPVDTNDSIAAKSLAKANVGLPATPVLLLIEIPDDGATSDLCAHVSAAVRTANPVDARASIAAKSLTRVIVGSPERPSPFVTEIPVVGPLIVRTTIVFELVLTTMPLEDREDTATIFGDANVLLILEICELIVTTLADSLVVVVFSVTTLAEIGGIELLTALMSTTILLVLLAHCLKVTGDVLEISKIWEVMTGILFLSF